MSRTSKLYNILVVEDEIEIARIIKSYLQLHSGFKNVVIAGDGVEAMQKLANQEFDLIITDIVMERRDGINFIDSLRRLPKYYKQKIMVISGCLTPEITLKLMKKNVRHIIVKPFTARQILLKAVMSLEITRNAKEFVDHIIFEVGQRLKNDREKMENAIPDDKVMAMIKKSRGE